MADTPSERRSSTAEVVDAATSGVKTLAGLTAQQALSFLMMIMVIFVCGLLAFQTYNLQRNQVDRDAMMLRENAAREEQIRQHCVAEAKDLRAFFADQNNRKLQFDTEAQTKLVAAIAALTARIEHLERTIKKSDP